MTDEEDFLEKLVKLIMATRVLGDDGTYEMSAPKFLQRIGISETSSGVREPDQGSGPLLKRGWPSPGGIKAEIDPILSP
jgi:hypothetical protein